MTDQLDRITNAIMDSRITRKPCNISINADQFYELLESISNNFYLVPEDNPKEYTHTYIMGKLLIPTDYGFLLWTGCEYCYSTDLPAKPYDYWICHHCGAPICAG
jgi:hypothetical protein